MKQEFVLDRVGVLKEATQGNDGWVNYMLSWDSGSVWGSPEDTGMDIGSGARGGEESLGRWLEVLVFQPAA